MLTKQITHLSIDIKKPIDLVSRTAPKIFGLILSLCKRLTVLNFCDVFLTRNWPTSVFNLPPESYMSSTLIKLNVNVTTFADCLYLLDGRLDSLSTLIINVGHIFDPIKDIGSRVSIISMIGSEEKH